MERKVDLRPPSAVAAEAGHAAARCDLLRHAQAVIKRQRPLPAGLIPNLDQRVRRLVSGKLRDSDGSERGVSLFDQNVKPEQMDLSLTASSTMGAMTESSVSHDVGVSRRDVGASDACNQPDFDSKFMWSYQLNSIGEGQRSTHYSANSAQTGLTSMLGSESYCGAQIDYANEENLSPCVQQELQSSEACTVGTLPENLMRKPVAQLSRSGLTFATITSQHSFPASLLNSTTQSAVNSVGLETIDAFKLHLQPVVTQGDSLMHFGLSHSGYNRVSKPTVVSAQVSGSAPQISVGSEDQSLLNHQVDKIKNFDGLKAVHFSDAISKGERNHAVKPCETMQASMPEQKLMPAENVKNLSNVVKTVKDTSGKSNISSKKKSSSSDLIVKVNGKLYQKLGVIGSGGSCEVYKVISSDKTIYALKMIKLKGRDYSMAYGFCQEIEYLNKLKGNNNIIQLIDYEVTNKTLLEQLGCNSMTTRDGTFNDEGHIYMVLEYGEIDLAHMLSQKWKDMNNSFEKLDENWLRFYWQQMLLAVNTIHQERIVHSDLKPANFLLVKGLLKLIDFGIAKAIMSDTTNIQRDAQMGTLNYMSPEAYMWDEEDPGGSTIKCGRPSDIWSLGCILYQMVYGHTPFSECKNYWAKFKAITDRNRQIKYGPVSNPWLLDLMKKCLAWDRDQRWRIPQLLQHPFLVPPATPQFSPSRYEHCKLLSQIAEAYGNNNPEVFSLCNQLHDIIANTDENVTCITSYH